MYKKVSIHKYLQLNCSKRTKSSTLANKIQLNIITFSQFSVALLKPIVHYLVSLNHQKMSCVWMRNQWGLVSHWLWKNLHKQKPFNNRPFKNILCQNLQVFESSAKLKLELEFEVSTKGGANPFLAKFSLLSRLCFIFLVSLLVTGTHLYIFIVVSPIVTHFFSL